MSGASLAAARIVLDALERNQLADEERDELVCHVPARLEEPLFSADEAHGNVAEIGELCEEAGLCLCVRDHDVGGAESVAVDALERTGCERARREAASVGDERVGERHERVEHDRAAARGTVRSRQVEVARIADDERVEVTRSPK